MIETKIITWYLQMLDPADFKPKFTEDENLEVREVKIPDFRYNRFLYTLVGAQWNWTDKLKWEDEIWRAYAEDKNLYTHVAYYRGAPAGYFELKSEENGDVKIEYFGLSTKFIGKGLGAHLLSCCIVAAWALKAKRVWVHTCNLDHPAALKNYQARGMKLYETKES